MIFNNSVTLYHNTGSSYSRKYFVRTHIFFEEKIDTGNGGQVSNNSITVRIFTHDTPEISTGDKLVLGYSESLEPPDDSHTITGVTKNCCGSGNTRHYKIKAV